MNKEERFNYIKLSMKIHNIEIHESILKRLIKIIDLIDKKEGQTNIKDILDAKTKKDN